MHIGTRIFNKLTTERECQVKRWNHVKPELDRLLVEYDHCESAEQIALLPSANSNRLTPCLSRSRNVWTCVAEA